MNFHGSAYGSILLTLGFICTLASMTFWWRDCIRESTCMCLLKGINFIIITFLYLQIICWEYSILNNTFYLSKNFSINESAGNLCCQDFPRDYIFASISSMIPCSLNKSLKVKILHNVTPNYKGGLGTYLAGLT